SKFALSNDPCCSPDLNNPAVVADPRADCRSTAHLFALMDYQRRLPPAMLPEVCHQRSGRRAGCRIFKERGSRREKCAGVYLVVLFRKHIQKMRIVSAQNGVQQTCVWLNPVQSCASL